LYTRYSVHLSELRRGVKHHKDSVLRRAWLKYGENNFIFEIFLRVEDKACLVKLEEKYLQELEPYKPSIGYNMDKSSIGFTTETASLAIQKQILNGRKWTGENNGNAKLNEQQALEIRNLFLEKRLNTIELGRLYKVDKMSISNILSGKTWGFAEDLRPKRLSGEEQLSVGKYSVESKLSVKELSERYGVSIPSIRRAIQAYKKKLNT